MIYFSGTTLKPISKSLLTAMVTVVINLEVICIRMSRKPKALNEVGKIGRVE